MSSPATFDGELFSSAKCVITGGLGFIGSNLVHALALAGAELVVVDKLVPEHGGNIDNVAGLDVEVLMTSIADPDVADAIVGADFIFNVAGQVSHIASMRDPQQDLRLNATSHGVFLDTVRAVAPRARIIHTSTRQVYGRPVRLPVDELHPAHPVDVNGVAKLAGEQLHMVYAHAYDMAITTLRLTNVYGPRQRLSSDELGFLPVFLRRALRGEQIEIFGDGTQRRDCLHVDDVIDAILTAATNDVAIGQMYNIGNVDNHSLADIASLMVEITESGASVQLTAWPSDHERLDIGSVHIDGSKAHRELGWLAQIGLRDGLRRTISFYHEHPWYLSSI